MKKPVIAVRLLNSLLGTVKVVESPFQPMTNSNSSGSTDKNNKQPILPLLPSQLPNSKETDNNSTEDYLSIFDKEISPPARFILHDENIEGVSIPKRLPANSSHITTVEWDLRPGDSRVESYHIGHNKNSKHWFLIQCTRDDLHPYSTRYLEFRSIAMVEKGNLKIEEAAILLLECAWEFERQNWSTQIFFMVSNEGLLDKETVLEVAERVWPEEGEDE
jgi:hypothetical protein